MATFARTQYVSNPENNLSHVLFRNIPNTGKVITIRRLWVQCATFCIGFRDGAALLDNPAWTAISTSEVGPPHGLNTDRREVLYDSNGSGILSKAELYGQAIPEYQAIQMGQIANFSGSCVWDEPLVLQEGRAVMVRAGGPGMVLLTNWVWDEDDAPTV